mmetsp:Transcript_10143/g.22778  ORF Transcript_10143/g.22778 Transcript_10143/m.22778 type:complete len:256 (-) Transcript_10143:5568-6335(-)
MQDGERGGDDHRQSTHANHLGVEDAAENANRALGAEAECNPEHQPLLGADHAEEVWLGNPPGMRAEGCNLRIFMPVRTHRSARARDVHLLILAPAEHGGREELKHRGGSPADLGEGRDGDVEWHHEPPGQDHEAIDLLHDEAKDKARNSHQTGGKSQVHCQDVARQVSQGETCWQTASGDYGSLRLKHAREGAAEDGCRGRMVEGQYHVALDQLQGPDHQQPENQHVDMTHAAVHLGLLRLVCPRTENEHLPLYC